MDTGYREVVLSGRWEPLLVAAVLAESGLFGAYVIYERPGELRLAADPLGEVTVEDGSVRRSWLGTTHREPLGARPFAQLGRVLSTVPQAGWTAYGYAGFELACPGGGWAPGVAAGTLFAAIVPGTEVRVTRREILIRCADRARLAEVRDLLVRETAGWPRFAGEPHPVRVDTPAARTRYEALVAEAVTEIRRDALDKVILSRTVDCPFEVDLPRTYLRGRRANTPARSFLLRLGRVRALGLSPEIVLAVGADRTVTTEPLAGTAALGAGAAADAELRRRLLRDPKEVYEHAISVRTALHELRPVCAYGEVAVDEFMAVKERGSVQHLGSSLRGRLGPDLSCWDALAAVFPAVTASGIPKSSACDVIRRLESHPRLLYGGAVFTAGSDGTLDAALVLRALIDHGDGPRLQAGAGIVASSSPAREYTETCEKLRSVADHLVPRADLAPSGIAARGRPHTGEAR